MNMTSKWLCVDGPHDDGTYTLMDGDIDIGNFDTLSEALQAWKEAKQARRDAA